MNRKAYRWKAALLALLLLLGAAPGKGEAGCVHQWSAVSSVGPSCTEEGYEVVRCALCGAEMTRSIPPLGHAWDMCTMVAAPTCTKDGVIRCFCARDASHYEDKALPAIGHSWTDWRIVKAATRTKSGLSERSCPQCGAVEQFRIPPRTRPPVKIYLPWKGFLLHTAK